MNLAGIDLSALECSNCTQSLSYGAGLCWAAKAAKSICSGSCGTHGNCADYGTECKHCGDCETSCDCDVCGNCGELEDNCSCCGSCGSSGCDTCDDCGEPQCECGCSEDYDSGDDYHSGDARFGSIKVAPWIARGIKVDPPSWGQSNRGNDALEAWGVDTSIDLCQAAADKYLLAGLADGVANRSEPDAYLSLLRSEASTMLSDLTARLDRTFCGYLDAIIGGELRHHRAASGTNLSGTSRKGAWREWQAIRAAGGSSVLADAVTLFEDFHSSSYGGAAWAAIAQCRLDRETGRLSPKLFVEMCWMLQHNGGSLFDKGQWSVSNRMGWSFYELNTWVLPAHGAEQNPWTVLLAVASAEVRDLFTEYWRQANRVRLAWGQRAERMPESRIPMSQDYWGQATPDHEAAAAAGMIGVVHV